MTMSHLVVFFLTITTKTLDPDLLTNLTLGQSLHLLVFRLKTVPSIVGANHLPVNWCHSKSTLSNPAGPSALFWSHLLNLRTPSPLHRHISPPHPPFGLFHSQGATSSPFSLRERPSLMFQIPKSPFFVFKISHFNHFSLLQRNLRWLPIILCPDIQNLMESPLL